MDKQTNQILGAGDGNKFSDKLDSETLAEMLKKNPDEYIKQLEQDTKKALKKENNNNDLTEKQKNILQTTDLLFNAFKKGDISEEKY
jgi:Leucine-rich repeat (LRR) protein